MTVSDLAKWVATHKLSRFEMALDHGMHGTPIISVRIVSANEKGERFGMDRRLVASDFLAAEGSDFDDVMNYLIESVERGIHVATD